MSRAIDPNIPYLIDGQPMVAGYVYYGIANQDPKLNPITIYSDSNFTVPITNPQRTGAQGKVENAVYISELEYSFLVTDVDDNQVEFEPALEPLNSDALVQEDKDMNGFKFLNVADAEANNQLATLGQSNKNYPIIAIVDALLSTPDALVATTPIPLDALLDNQQVIIQIPNSIASNTINPSFKLDAFSDFQMYRDSNDDLNVGDTMGPFAFLHLGFSAPLNKWQLLNPPIQGIISNDIDMDGYKHFNVADADANDQYGTLGQNNKLYAQVVDSDGSSAPDAIVANIVPAIDSLDNGQAVIVNIRHGQNTILTPTLNLNGFGGKIIYREQNQDLMTGDTGGADYHCIFVYNSSLDRFQLVNPENKNNRNFQNNTIDGGRIVTGSISATQLGSDSVGPSEIAPDAVSQGELDTDTGSVNYTGTGNNNLVLPGGQHGFYPQVKVNGAQSAPTIRIANFLYTASYRTNIYLDGGDFLGSIIDARQTYILNSPPYDIGDGEIPLFVYAAINSKGEIISTYQAKTPPWAYNGPTDISGKYQRDGRKIRKSKGANLKSKSDFDAYMEGNRIETSDLEITMDIKNADMSLIPHPFDIKDKDGKPEDYTVVLLDPCETLKLMDLHDEGQSMYELYSEKYLQVDNTFVEGRKQPSEDTKIMRIKWK
jgi:hypothetical protein